MKTLLNTLREHEYDLSEVLIGAAVVTMIFALWWSHYMVPPCEKEKVVELVQNRYRTLTVRTASGKVFDLYSPSVKPGDMVCVPE